MCVELVHWPEEQARLDALRRTNRPRLLLVEHSAAPPRVVDEIEDWIRLPADHRDVTARVDWLRRRAEPAATIEDGVARTGLGSVIVPELEGRLLATLLSRIGRVVDRPTLMAAGWPDSSPSRNVLDVHLHRLRQRIGPIGLEIRTVRKRGYVLELDAGGPAP